MAAEGGGPGGRLHVRINFARLRSQNLRLSLVTSFSRSRPRIACA